VTVAGNATPSDAATETYTVSNSGDATGLSYAWSVSGDGVANGGTTGTSFDVDVSTGNATVTCVVSSSDAGVTDSPATGTLSLTIT